MIIILGGENFQMINYIIFYTLWHLIQVQGWCFLPILLTGSKYLKSGYLEYKRFGDYSL